MPGGAKIHVTMHGDGNVTAKITGWKLALANFMPVWDDWSKDMAAFHGGQFATEGAFGGNKWAPLDPTYRARKIAEGHSDRILVRTGKMLAEATNPRKLLRRATPKRASFAIPTRYYRFHHTGAPRNGMPQRRVSSFHPVLQAALRRRVKERLG